MTHRELSENLRDTLSGIKTTALIEVPLGSKWMSPECPVADVVQIRNSYTRFCISIYEVKTSRSDFLQDLKCEKWRAYLPHCNRFYFAVEDSILRQTQLPEECGLLKREKKGWHTVKTAPERNIEIPTDTLLSLIMKRQMKARDVKVERDYWMSRRAKQKIVGHNISHAIGLYEYWLGSIYEQRIKGISWELEKKIKLLIDMESK